MRFTSVMLLCVLSTGCLAQTAPDAAQQTWTNLLAEANSRVVKLSADVEDLREKLEKAKKECPPKVMDK